MGSGTVTIRAPRVHDQRVVDGGRQKFTSQTLPPSVRRSPKVSAVLLLLYLHGLSSGDFQQALPVLLGKDAAGLSPAAITRLTATWRTEYDRWQQQSLADRDFIYVWVDGVHVNIRLEEDRLAALVVIGVRPDGTKELIAIEDGYRESTESWLGVLRNLTLRGLRAPALAIGDGALGFWAAVREVWPETREQRCWVHRIANVLDKLPHAAPAPGETGLARHDVCDEPGDLRGHPAALRPRLRGQVSQGGQSAVRRRPQAPDALRLPRRPLEAYSDDAPDRVHLRHGEAADAGDQGHRLPCRRPDDGVQAAAGGTTHMAPPRRA